MSEPIVEALDVTVHMCAGNEPTKVSVIAYTPDGPVTFPAITIDAFEAEDICQPLVRFSLRHFKELMNAVHRPR